MLLEVYLMLRCRASRSRGIVAGDLLVVLTLAALVVLLVLLSLPRQQSASRGAVCRANLSRIGIALVLFDESRGRLPGVPELSPQPPARSSPWAGLLDAFGQDDFRGFTTVAKPPSRGSREASGRLLGLLCPEDPAVRGTTFSTPTSYRATAGTVPEGGDGPFAPGRRSSLATIEAGAGLAYTALVSERLLGPGRPVPSSPALYEETNRSAGPVQSQPRYDAGSRWGRASWADTLYNHVQPPMTRGDWVAADGVLGVITASSGHPAGVHLLRGDLSVQTVTSRVDPVVWRALGGCGPTATTTTPRAAGPSPDASVR